MIKERDAINFIQDKEKGYYIPGSIKQQVIQFYEYRKSEANGLWRDGEISLLQRLKIENACDKLIQFMNE